MDWILHPILSEALSKTYHHEHEIERDLTLLQIASFYTRMEQIAERVDAKNRYIDSLELDKVFIINRRCVFRSNPKRMDEYFSPKYK